MSKDRTFNPSANGRAGPRFSWWAAVMLSVTAHAAIAAGLMVEDAGPLPPGTVIEVAVGAAPAGLPRAGSERRDASVVRPPSVPEAASPTVLSAPPAAGDIPAAPPLERARPAFRPVEAASKPADSAALREAPSPSGAPPDPTHGRARKQPAAPAPAATNDAAGHVGDPGGSFVPPRYALGAAANPLPDYPRQARRESWEGRVVLSVSVAAEGHAAAVTVRQSSGYSILDEAALAAVRRWRFEPARRGGLPIAASVDVPIRFRLEDPE